MKSPSVWCLVMLCVKEPDVKILGYHSYSTCCQGLWSQMDVLPNSWTQHWKWLLVLKWWFNSRATALLDVPAVYMPIHRSLKTSDTFVALCCVKLQILASSSTQILIKPFYWHPDWLPPAAVWMDYLAHCYCRKKKQVLQKSFKR